MVLSRMALAYRRSGAAINRKFNPRHSGESRIGSCPCGFNRLGAVIMFSNSKARALLIAALAGAAALAAAAQAETKYLIDHEVWGGYQKYLGIISNTKPGAFAITTNGHSYYYTYCRDIQCLAGPSYSHVAKQRCESEFGEECVVFAIRRDIRVEYEIRK